MGFSTATAWEGFSEGCADDAEGSWGCQVEAAEQRVGFFNQELRPINFQPDVSRIAAEAQKICLIGDRRQK